MADQKNTAPNPDPPSLPSSMERWAPFENLKCTMAVEIPLPGFKVRNLLALEENAVIDTGWAQSQEIPVRANGQVLANGNFEVTNETLSVRLTEVV